MSRGSIPQHLIKRRSPEGRACFMWLDEGKPDFEFQRELGEYQCSIMINSDHIGTLKDEIDTLIETTVREVRSNQAPYKSYPYEILHSGSVQKYLDITGIKGNAGDMILKSKTKAHFKDKNTGLLKPNFVKVYDPQGKPMKEVPYTFKGSPVEIVYNLFPWSFGGKVGVRCSLHEVHFIDLIEFTPVVEEESSKVPTEKVDTGEYGLNK